MKVNKIHAANNHFAWHNNKNSKTQSIKTSAQNNLALPNYAHYAPLFLSFGSTSREKSPYTNFDLLFINRLKEQNRASADKINLEKINPHKLKEIAEEKLAELKAQSFEAQNEEIDLERQSRLSEWREFLDAKYPDNPVDYYIIYSAITRGLKPKNKDIPILLNEKVAEKALETMGSDYTTDINQLSFKKIYEIAIQKHALGLDDMEDKCQWIKIPSRHNDRENYRENTDKLMQLSPRTWCTKYRMEAAPQLRKGDFYVYLVNGQPKLAVALKGNKIAEIQGVQNDCDLPLKYLEVVEEFLAENDDLKQSLYTKMVVKKAQKGREKGKVESHKKSDVAKRGPIARVKSDAKHLAYGVLKHC